MIETVTIILLTLVMIPITATLDYHLLKNNYRITLGKDPGRWFWLWPCFLELVLFDIGLIFGSVLN